jgi:outer membrane protein OmpU
LVTGAATNGAAGGIALQVGTTDVGDVTPITIIAGAASSLSYAATYTGIDGLSVSYGVGEQETSSTAQGDTTTMKASYAYGPVTVAATNTNYDSSGTTNDQELSSMKISYTVSDAISIGYGVEDISITGSSDAEFEGFNASYTAGGMTVSAAMQDGKNIDHGTDAAGQADYWSL